MSEKKQLNVEELEQVTGGRGDRIYYGEIESVPIGSEIIFNCGDDGRIDHKVFLKRVDLANDAVYVTPSGQKSIDWFARYCGNSAQDDPNKLDDITDMHDGTYKIYYTRWSTTYFHW